MRRFPVVATVVVLAAVATMVGLGLWQVQRRAWKNDLVARYAAASRDPAVLVLPGLAMPRAAAYRHVRWDCPEASADQVVGGRSADGHSGWAHAVICRRRDGDRAVTLPVVIGWSSGLAPVHWAGGTVTGVAVPGPKAGVVTADADPRVHPLDWHLVADPPLAGLAANALPDPRDIPNNHWSYAIQWFAFALTALVIYGLALRRR